MLRVIETAVLPTRIRELLDGQGPLYLQPHWLDALSRAYPRFHPRHLVLYEDGRSAGVLPVVETLRLRGFGAEVVSLPFGSYGGPVLAPGVDIEGARLLVRAYRRFIDRRRVFRHDLTAFEVPEAVGRVLNEELGDLRVPDRTWLIDLDRKASARWDSYEGRARTAVRKARKSGVTAGIETGSEAVDVFFELHRAQSLTRANSWHHAREALAAVVEALGADAQIWVARHEGRPVCAALVVVRPGREAHPWLTGAIPASRPLNAFQYLVHEAMEHAAENGCRLWNFGPSAGSESVEYFKTGFSGRWEPLMKYYREASWVPVVRRLVR